MSENVVNGPAATTPTKQAPKTKPVKAPKKSGVMILPKLDRQVIQVPIIGTSSLVVQAWSQKAINMMLAKQMGVAQLAKEPKDPEADYLASRYIADQNYDFGTKEFTAMKEEDFWDGFPCGSFKSAIVGAVRQMDGMTMTTAKRVCFLLPDGKSTSQNGIDLVRIYGSHHMRRDLVRNDNGGADIRFRAEFLKWEAVLTVQFNSSMISAEQLVTLIDIAGYSEGIGEWRPSSPKVFTGDRGRWEVKKG